MPGKFLGAPYDWRKPRLARIKKAFWNPRDRRVLVPKSWGWGWSINFARLFGRRR